jgi:N-methylhydantoinase A/oxoprolinase/acetone carboxylase beta subunit
MMSSTTLLPDSLFLGIDTGGTFTDGVLLDPVTRKVLRTAKVLTTHHDLRLCIANVLKELAPPDPTSIHLVSLSTTLATNAIAEGKRRPVALLLSGYDPELIRKFGFDQQFGTSEYHYIPGQLDLEGRESQPLDEASVTQVAQTVLHRVDALAVSTFAGARNPRHEETAGRILAQATGLPVVQAHHLSTELDSIRRATTASLNASLLGHTRDFLDAVEAMLADYGFHCPVMIVRGDGSVVRAGFARERPVEIIHSGPATSAIGGQFLSGLEQAIVIDIGGTTTDIAVVERGQVRSQDQAATVGAFRTSVRTIEARSIGLGGDSQISFDAFNLQVGPERVIPLSHIAADHPEIRKEILLLTAQDGPMGGVIRTSEKLEYWRLRREPARKISDSRIQKAVDLLRSGPRRLTWLLKEVGAVSPHQLGVSDLLNQEVIERAGLTPTDLLHASGEYSPWDAEVARRVINTVAENRGQTPDQFCAAVRQLITEMISSEILQFLSGKILSVSGLAFKDEHLDRWLFEESLTPRHAYLGSRIFLKVPIVGIGAPARAFLTPVAAALGTQIIFPEHFNVANAVGTVVGSVVVRKDGEVLGEVTGQAITGYTARAGSQQEHFKFYEDARAYALHELRRLTMEEAARAGAQVPEIHIDEYELIPGVSLRIQAWAAGKPYGQFNSQGVWHDEIPA